MKSTANGSLKNNFHPEPFIQAILFYFTSVLRRKFVFVVLEGTAKTLNRRARGALFPALFPQTALAIGWDRQKHPP